jgi:hypothetical protein
MHLECYSSTQMRGANSVTLSDRSVRLEATRDLQLASCAHYLAGDLDRIRSITGTDSQSALEQTSRLRSQAGDQRCTATSELPA